MQERLTRLWYDDASSRSSLLGALSWMYGRIGALRTGAYAAGWLRTERAGSPVIVVGNLTVGGTGKTPVVAWLAEQLTGIGLRVGIVSRGYGRSFDRPHLVESDSDWREVGDEPLLLRRRTGCLTMVGRDRAAAAKALVARGVDVIVADDGLQHLRLARDCEIVVIDGSRGFGNGRLLPAGPLREPVERLCRTDVAIVNGPREHRSLERPLRSWPAVVLGMSTVAGDACHIAPDVAPRPLESFRGQRVHAVAGIGNPSRFFRDLRSRGIEVLEHPFADHHPLSARELDFPDALEVLMTEKDAVKCRGLANPRLWYVPIQARFGDGQERELLQCVLRRTGLAGSAQRSARAAAREV